MVLELKPHRPNKRTVVEDFMAEAPFRDRVPVFVGDDITDEDGFAAVQSYGGAAIVVGLERETGRTRQRTVRPERSEGAASLAGGPVRRPGGREMTMTRGPPSTRRRRDRQLQLRCADRSARAHLLGLPAALRRRPGVPLAPGRSRRSRPLGRRLLRCRARRVSGQRAALHREHRDTGHDAPRRQRRRGADHRLRAPVRAVRALLSPHNDRPHHRTVTRRAAHPHPPAAAIRLRRASPRTDPGQQPHPLRRPATRPAVDHGRPGFLHHRRDRLRPRTAPHPAARAGREPDRARGLRGARVPKPNGELLARVRCAISPCRSNGRRP